MTTNNFYKSDLPKIHSVVQNAMTLYPKELVVYALRDFFSRDHFYRSSTDAWGYPQTQDHTNLPLSAGFNDSLTTRLLITDSHRFDVAYYPALIVRHGGSTSVPVSINRETSTTQWGSMVFTDGYGNIKTFPYPLCFIFAGAWEGSINIEVIARDTRTRDDLVDLVSLFFVDIGFNDLQKSGLFIKGVASGSPSETDDRNDKLFRQTITLQIRSEWRREISIGNIIEIINTTIEFGRTDPITSPIAENLTIRNNQNLLDILSEL